MKNGEWRDFCFFTFLLHLLNPEMYNYKLGFTISLFMETMLEVCEYIMVL